MLNTNDILETIKMIREENLDIRTVTMGISLFDCISDDQKRLEEKIYDKVMGSAKNLVKVCEELERISELSAGGVLIIAPCSNIFSDLVSECEREIEKRFVIAKPNTLLDKIYPDN